jgi:16S rRNA (uracil1498-N3)-methyltransferase
MQVFYAPDITDGHYILDERESRHSIRVMRMKKGELVRLIDGRGNLFQGTIAVPDPHKCIIEIESVIKNFETRPYKLHMAISPLKNPDRFEWFVEKSVEIGVDEITPVVCCHTEKTGIKIERTKGLIISAMKQSLKAKETILNEVIPFSDFIRSDREGCLMIAHCNSKLKRSGIADLYSRGDNALILIGPEGDFSEDEILSASERGFNPVHLGNSRLRSETAGITACHSIYFMNQ